MVFKRFVFPPRASFSGFLSLKIIPNLDGLRGMAILLVLIHHLPEITHPVLKNLQENGRLGVMLFFVISGFLITHLALKEQENTGGFDLKAFYTRRSLRIFPLYYAVLAFVCLLVFVFNVYSVPVKQEFSSKLPSYLFYYSNLITPVSGPYSLLWSLAVEEQFYLFFALVFAFFGTRVSQIIFLALTALRLTMPWWGTFFADTHLLLIAFRYQEAILLGVSLAFALHHQKSFEFVSKVLPNPISLSALLISLAFLLNFFSIKNEAWLEPAISVLFTLLVAGAALMPSLFLIGGQTLSYIGKISYGMYLFHTIVFFGIKKYISDEAWVVFLLGTPATIAVAALSYTYFESYFLKRKATK